MMAHFLRVLSLLAVASVSVSGAPLRKLPAGAASPAAMPAATLGLPAVIQKEGAALAASVWQQAAAIPSLREYVAFAQQSRLRLALVPFDGQPPRLGLNEDHLAQLEPEEHAVYVNWSMVAPDLRAFQNAGLSETSARRLVGLSLAPVAGHEIIHSKLRRAHGRWFPGVREEEILTHLIQGQAFDEVLVRHRDLAALAPLLERSFLFRHNRQTHAFWNQGFSQLAHFTGQKYSQAPSINDDPKDNAARARADLDRLDSANRPAPAFWRERLMQSIEFWESPEAVKKVTALLQGEIDAAYARFMAYRRQRRD